MPGLLAAAAAGACLFCPAGGSASAGSSHALVRRVSISGHGYGHGVGLSQWGAYERAMAGRSHMQILSFYFPGTTIGRAPDIDVRILLADRARPTIGSDAPFTVTDARGRRVELAAGRYSVSATLRLGLERLAAPVVVAPGRRLLALDGRLYRGTFTLRRHDDGVRVVNTLDLESYVADVVSYEDPAYWPAEALRSQAIASRSYALANLRPTRNFDLYSDDRSQNYAGLRKEFPSGVAAAAATRGRVLRYGSEIVDAFFSGSNGGLTRDAAGAFDGAQLPYFKVRRDRFDAMSPASAWGPVVTTVARLRRAFPHLPPDVIGIVVRTNAAGRVDSITFTGARGTHIAIGGAAFEQRLGLRSPYFSLSG
jgi:stage II sporulation protein D